MPPFNAGSVGNALSYTYEGPMLVVTRKKDEKLMIGDDIEVQILRIGRENVRIGVKAPANVSIYRHEIYEAIQKRKKAAAGTEAEEPAVEGVAPRKDATRAAGTSHSVVDPTRTANSE